MSGLKEAVTGFISSSDVIEKAAKIGVSATATSLSRYQKEGLMLLPNRDCIKKSQGRPANYHPLCICELASATWMYKGFFPSLNDPRKKLDTIARFSTDDILYARAKFYLSDDADTLVTKHKLPALSLLEYQIPGKQDIVSSIRYKKFLEGMTMSMEEGSRRAIEEDENKYFRNEIRKKEHLLEVIGGSSNGLSPYNVLEALSKREYATSAYRLLYYRAFFMLKDIYLGIL